MSARLLHLNFRLLERNLCPYSNMQIDSSINSLIEFDLLRASAAYPSCLPRGAGNGRGRGHLLPEKNNEPDELNLSGAAASAN
jgi:hypothetical protein